MSKSWRSGLLFFIEAFAFFPHPYSALRSAIWRDAEKTNPPIFNDTPATGRLTRNSHGYVIGETCGAKPTIPDPAR